MDKLEETKKYLPIGTVVILKNGTKRLMITGFCYEDETEAGKIYDYSGCLYPEGIMTSDKNLLFNHEQIDKIYAIGYSDEEEKQFKERLAELLKTLNEE